MCVCVCLYWSVHSAQVSAEAQRWCLTPGAGVTGGDGPPWEVCSSARLFSASEPSLKPWEVLSEGLNKPAH